LYKLETSITGKLAEHFWEDFNFNNGYPVKIARYSLIVPASRPFRYQMYNSDLKPTISDVDAYKMYVWEKNNSASIQNEPYSRNLAAARLASVGFEQQLCCGRHDYRPTTTLLSLVHTAVNDRQALVSGF